MTAVLLHDTSLHCKILFQKFISTSQFFLQNKNFEEEINDRLTYFTIGNEIERFPTLYSLKSFWISIINKLV